MRFNYLSFTLWGGPNLRLEKEATVAKATQYKIISGVGRVRVEFDGLLMNQNDMAFASITEVDARDNPVFGSTVMRVNNVTPLQNRVIVRCYIGWSVIPFPVERA
ncbi:CheA signal transduction histidine kinase [Mycolicibacterium rhodesiae JS60]|nr:CheA signal transduction histidine kinase [Mycolicibacterium rhodesiae JS60]